MLKADLHIHTRYSMDCSTTLEQVINECQKKDINCVAIADHGAIDGALRMKEVAPFPVIVAEEILTTRGEIMGMFLEELVPSGLSMEESITRIKAQGGLLCIPHPFDMVRQSALNSDTIEKIVEQIDVLEVFNARSLLLSSSNKSRTFAKKYGIPGSAGSDAHNAAEIGNVYVEMREFDGKADFLKALSDGKVCGRKTSLFAHFNSTLERIKHNLAGNK